MKSVLWRVRFGPHPAVSSAHTALALRPLHPPMPSVHLPAHHRRAHHHRDAHRRGLQQECVRICSSLRCALPRRVHRWVPPISLTMATLRVSGVVAPIFAQAVSVRNAMGARHLRRIPLPRTALGTTCRGLGFGVHHRARPPRAEGRSSMEERQQEEERSLAKTEDGEEIFPENGLSNWLYPPEEELPDDKEMSIFDHLEELRDRLLVSVVAVGIAIIGCFVFAKDLIVLLEKPVYSLGVRFLALSPGEYFFTTLKVSGYCGLLLGSPVILYEIISFVVPGLTRSEKKLLGPVVFGSSFLFYAGLLFSYTILTPAALNFFVSYAEGVVESLWSIDQYFEFVLVLMFSTGLSFQVPVIQLLLGQTGLVSGDQMLSVWRYVVVGAVIAAAVLTPSTDPLTQCLLAGPLIGLYMGGAFAVKFLVNSREPLELED